MIDRLLAWLEARDLDWTNAASVIAVLLVIGLLSAAAWGWIG